MKTHMEWADELVRRLKEDRKIMLPSETMMQLITEVRAESARALNEAIMARDAAIESERETLDMFRRNRGRLERERDEARAEVERQKSIADTLRTVGENAAARADGNCLCDFVADGPCAMCEDFTRLRELEAEVEQLRAAFAQAQADARRAALSIVAEVLMAKLSPATAQSIYEQIRALLDDAGAGHCADVPVGHGCQKCEGGR